MRGKGVSFFENQFHTASRFVTSPGGRVDLKSYPHRIAGTIPKDLERLAIPRGCKLRAGRYLSKRLRAEMTHLARLPLDSWSHLAMAFRSAESCLADGCLSI